jgi:predicted transcriptional regulator
MADETNTVSGPNNVELAAQLTVAWLGNPNVRAAADEVPGFLRNVHATLNELSGSGGTGVSTSDENETAYVPAVPVRSSVKPDHILSLIDGKKYKLLKRHLARHGLSPQEYRERYGLKADYPMVAPNYAASRRALAHKIGLGRKPGEKVPARRRRTAKPAS